MTLLTLIAVLLVVGVLLWAVQTIDFIDPRIKKAIVVITVVVLSLWVIGNLLGEHAFNPRLW